MKFKIGFGKCPRCHAYGILAKIQGIKPLCTSCLGTVKKLLQGD